MHKKSKIKDVHPFLIRMYLGSSNDQMNHEKGYRGPNIKLEDRMY